MSTLQHKIQLLILLINTIKIILKFNFTFKK